MDRETIIHGAKMELARREFFSYCNIMAPDFYREDREYLVNLCNALQEFIEGPHKIMTVAMPPRHGKSRTGVNLTEWLLGEDPRLKTMIGTYNEMLSSSFSRQVRNTIAAEKADKNIVYSDIFPKTRIKYGEASMKQWALEGSDESNYLATSPGGTSTGFGCDYMIIDDLIKTAEEAYNEERLQANIDWFENTMMQRTESGFKIIVFMTRWATKDLTGHLIANYDNVQSVSYKALDKGRMLCPSVLTYEEYKFKTKNMNPDIREANYQQTPIDIKGKLYTRFKTYTELPKDENGNLIYAEIKNYTDTADEGSDYLCSIDYLVWNDEVYVLDIMFTKDPMEITEPAQARMMHKDNVSWADIESNNGGRGYARNVKRHLEEDLKDNRCHVHWFHQSKNKLARILSNSTWVMDHIYYPVKWKDRWPDYFDAMNKFQREGKNAHDDAPDTTTGVAEMHANSKVKIKTFKGGI